MDEPFATTTSLRERLANRKKKNKRNATKTDEWDLFKGFMWDTCPICKHARVTMAHDWRCDEIMKLQKKIEELQTQQPVEMKLPPGFWDEHDDPKTVP